MAGSIEEVQLHPIAGSRLVIHCDRMRFDRDSPLTLKIHGIEELVLFFPI